MKRRFDHIDLRVSSMAEARPFYEKVLPALGFVRKAHFEGWLQFESEEPDGDFFGATEAAGHVPNDNRIAFWADSVAEVDRLTEVVKAAGARNIEGPGYESSYYYAVFFEDPCGNRLEICNRTPRDDGF